MTQPYPNAKSEEKKSGAGKHEAVKDPCGQIRRGAQAQRREKMLIAALTIRCRSEDTVVGSNVKSQHAKDKSKSDNAISGRRLDVNRNLPSDEASSSCNR
jgi:hypothetical protein